MWSSDILTRVFTVPPKDIAGVVQQQIDQAAKYADRIILGYGLCSNGIVGVTAGPQGLIGPSMP